MPTPNDFGANLWCKYDAGVYSDAGTTVCIDQGVTVDTPPAGSLVQQWNDQTGNGNHLTQTNPSTTRPVFSTSQLGLGTHICFDNARFATDCTNGISWTNCTTALNLPAAYSFNQRSFTLLIVVQENTVGGTINLFENTNYAIDIVNSTIIAQGPGNPTATQIWTGGLHFLIVRGDAAHCTFYLDKFSNSTAAGAMSAVTTTNGGFVCRTTGNNASNSAALYEFALWNTAIPDYQVQGMFDYLNSRYTVAGANPTLNIAFLGDVLFSSCKLMQSPIQMCQFPVSPSLRVTNMASQLTKWTTLSANVDKLLVKGAYNFLAISDGIVDVENSIAAATVYANMQTFMTARRAAGWQRLATTTIDNTGNGVAVNAIATAYNGLLCGDGNVSFDELWDFNNDPLMNSVCSAAKQWSQTSNAQYKAISNFIRRRHPEWYLPPSKQTAMRQGGKMTSMRQNVRPIVNAQIL